MTCPRCGLEPEKKTITRKQHRTYTAIAELSKELGYSPTYRMVANRIGCRSITTVCEHVQVLTERGWILHTKRARALVAL